MTIKAQTGPGAELPIEGAGVGWEIREGDALERLREMTDASVQCCVTSPPYFGLRCYGVDGQIGLEATPDEFVAKLVEVFREVRRVLRDDGTLWLNIGDSYNSGAQYNHDKSGLGDGDRYSEGGERWPGHRPLISGLKPKDLLGIPWLLAFALRADGWYLRSDVIWAKPNPMPESVTDRPTSAHEHVFLLSKSARYFYDADAIREPHTAGNTQNQFTQPKDRGDARTMRFAVTERYLNPLGRNRRNVWEIATQPYAEAHFATFPCKLVEPCILAGSSPKACGECGAPWVRVVERELVGGHSTPNSRPFVHRADGTTPNGSYAGGGHVSGHYEVSTTGWQSSCFHDDGTGHSVILDPFAGSGTTGLVALRHDRSFIGIELSPAYAEMARNRIRDDAPLLNSHAEAARA